MVLCCRVYPEPTKLGLKGFVFMVWTFLFTFSALFFVKLKWINFLVISPSDLHRCVNMEVLLSKTVVYIGKG